MMCVRVALVLVTLFGQNEALNLRSRERGFFQKESSEEPGIIPDPSCKKGVMSPDMKVCCTDDCGSCGNHQLCNDTGKFQEVTGKLADNCCKARIMKKAVSCDKNHPPCVLSPSYKESLDKYVIDRPKRHAMDDCNKAVPIARSSHALAIDKGEFFSRIYLDGKTKYKEALDISVKVVGLCGEKVEESEQLVKEYDDKIAQATDADKEENPLTGVSEVDKWKDAKGNERNEIKFYEEITENAKQVQGSAEKGFQAAKALRAEVEPVKDVQPYQVKLNLLIDDAEKVYADALALWKQWEDSSKDYPCGAPPAVNHAKSMCDSGNTKYSPKCDIVCETGYDGNGTKNHLRCNRQGNFGQQLYGEWMGMAACVGRLCGKPPEIASAKTVIQDIRYPNAANYVCMEGHSVDQKATGAKKFSVQCGTDGRFEKNSSHACQPISCGTPPEMKNTNPPTEEAFFTEVATYSCLDGHTTDGTAAGLTKFSRTCGATGKFTEGLGCSPVRCGPPPAFDHTNLTQPTSKADQFFGMESIYTCYEGYTVDPDHKPNGVNHYTLACQADGQFAMKDSAGDTPLPKCRPVCAGMAPAVAHGDFIPHKMCYGESVTVSAQLGYSITGNPGDGVSFQLSVTPDAKYEGLEKFIPVVCGKPPTVEGAKCKTSKDKAVFEDLLKYECDAGYSTDGSAQKATSSFSISCEADGTFSKVPNLGKCVNIDDCADHTCGPFGECVDHVQNYTCNCDSGYQQRFDNVSHELVCGNIDDCGPEACGVGKCHDLVNGYKCECPTGYEETSEENDEGKMDHTCVPVVCGLPPQVEHASTEPATEAGVKAFYQKHVVYRCAEGHTLNGSATGNNHFEIECQASKDFTEVKACEPIKCGSLPEVEHGKAAKTSATFNQSVRFDCDEGHTVDGTAGGDHGFTVVCQSTGTFGEAQACKPVSCGEPDTVANAARPSGNLYYKDKINYTCFEGFTLDGMKDGETKFSTECHLDGQLDNLKQCLPKVCGVPELINVLYASTKDEGEVRYPESTEVICRDGYTVGGDPGGASAFQVKCLSTGDFEKVDERECDPVRCGAPPKMANASLSEIKTPEPAQMAPLSLRLRHQKAPAIEMTEAEAKEQCGKLCLESNFCCNNPDIGSNQFFSCSQACMVRYYGASEQECLNLVNTQTQERGCSRGYSNGNGAWSFRFCSKCADLKDHCPWGVQSGDASQKGCTMNIKQVQTAEQPGLPSNDSYLNYEEKAIYKCNEGFTTGGEFNAPTTFKVECLPSGELSFPTVDQQCRNVNDCEQHTCGPKGKCVDLIGPAPAYTCECEHGYEIQINDDGEKHCGNKDDCQGKDCGVGVCTDLIGDYTCTCPSGYYIGEKDGSKTCVPARCSDDTPKVENGELKSEHEGPVDFPTTLRYQCEAGYSVDGSLSESMAHFQAQCESDGQLSGMGSCRKISCGSPHVVPFTRLVVPNNTRASVEYKDEAKYACLPGYTIGGNKSGDTEFAVECKADGILSDPKVCEPVKCGPAPTMPNSKPGISGDVKFGQNLVYMCDLGHTLDATKDGKTEYHRECTANGTFTPAPSSMPCHPVSPGDAPNITNADLTEYDGNNITQLPVRVEYPKGVEYRCRSGYSTNGALTGPTKITASVNSVGEFTPSLPTECKKISFTVAGRVKSAQNAMMLDGVKVTVEGKEIAGQTTSGSFTLHDVPGATLKLRYEKDGFISFERQLEVSGNVYAGGEADISMSPVMDTSEWRAVVQWGEDPRDLDTYAKWGSRKVFYGAMTREGYGVTGRLEVDDTSSYGPETLYFSGIGSCDGDTNLCDVKYEINDYTGTGRMLERGDALVTLYNGDNVAGEWKIADCPHAVTVQSGKEWWHVFTLDAKTNRLKWRCTDDAGGQSQNNTELQLLRSHTSNQTVANKDHFAVSASHTSGSKKSPPRLRSNVK